MNHCGSCNACCRVFDVPEVKSPAGEWCQHCSIGTGCAIYQDRPEVCVDFECLWLISQSRSDLREVLPPELRPDRCKVVFSATTNEAVMAATTMPGSPLAYEKPEVRRLIKLIVDGGMSVVFGQPRSTRRRMFDKDGSHEVRLTEPDADGIQYNIQKEQEADG